MDLKIKLNISGCIKIHVASPISPEHTLCGDQYAEDDGETIVLGIVHDNSKITCDSCEVVVKFCKEIS